MGARDKKIYQTLAQVYRECEKHNRELTQVKMANLIDTNPKTFSTWMDNDPKLKNFINLEKLAILYNNLNSSTDRCLNELKIEVPLIINEVFNDTFGFKTADEIITRIQDIRKNPLPNSILSLMDSSINSVVFLTSTDSNMLELLQDPLTFTWATEANLITHETSVTKIIESVESSLYSNKGNYYTPLNLKVFIRNYDPITEMVGFSAEGQFCAFLHQDGYKSMSQIGHELLLEENINLLNEEPFWSPPRSPDARFLTRLIRELSAILSSEDINFLNEKVNFLEANLDIQHSFVEWFIDEVNTHLEAKSALKIGKMVTYLILCSERCRII